MGTQVCAHSPRDPLQLKVFRDCKNSVSFSGRHVRARYSPGLHTHSPRKVGLADQRTALASATVRAVMLTMRRTVADGVKMCTGKAAPSKTGPIAIPPPAAVFNRL